MRLFPNGIAYCIVFAVGLVNAAWLAMSNISLPVSDLLAPAANIALMLAATVAINRHAFADAKAQKLLIRLGYFLQGLVFLQLSWLSIRVFNHMSMSTALPYTDDLLAGWDAALGFDWLAYFRFVQDNEFVRLLLYYSYDSLTLFSFSAFLLMMALPDLRRAQFFLETFLVTAVICTAAGMFFPAEAAVVHYYDQIGSLNGFETPPGVYHMQHMEQLRSGEAFMMDVNNLPGLVTFPSFHTAAGIILVASFWRSRLFVPSLVYTAVMIASTPIYGGHYFIDLIAGTAVALAVAWFYSLKPHYARMFRRGTRLVALPAPQAGLAKPG